MRHCLACGGACRAGTHHADDFLCRECQRSPATQMRVHLMRARRRGMSFEKAWDWAFERVRWPHDTMQRIEWKEIIEGQKIRGAFHAAYRREQITERAAHMANLELVA